MPYICLSNYSFVRCTPHRAYIANQSNGKQLIYDAAGGDWLNMLTHHPQTIRAIVERLAENYENVDVSELSEDFHDFIEVLVKEGFVVVGNTIDDIRCKNRETIEMQMDIPPITDLTIEVTNRCNERCIHCYLPDELKEKGSSMRLENLKALVDSFADMGGQTVTLTGGEALLFKDLSALLQHIQQRQLKVIVYSNLIALTDEILRELEGMDVDHIQTSLYAVHPEVHDRITGVKGSCERTLLNIERIARTCIPLKIACPVMKENRMDVIPLLNYAKRYMIPVELELNITARENQATDNLEHRLSMKEMETLLRELMAYDRVFTTNLLQRHKYTYNEEFSLAEYLNYPVCTAGHYGLYVTSSGKVTTCPNLQGIEMGHIKRTSLKEIWTESQELRALRCATECSFQQCVNCEASDFCFRCFARNYTETGDYMQIPEYACDMAFLAKRIVEEQDNHTLC